MRPSSWFRVPRRRSPLQVNRPWCRNCTERAVQSYSPGRWTCLVSPGGPLLAPGGPAQASAPSGWNDGLSSAWCATSAPHQRQCALDNASLARRRLQRCPTPGTAGSCCPSTRQLLRRGAARRRARAHSVDGWTTVYDQDGRPRAMPDELVGAPANRCCALLRQHDEPPYTLQPQNRAARDEGVAHTLPTHYERDATGGTREADGTLQICMRRRAFKLRRARIAARATARPSA